MDFAEASKCLPRYPSTYNHGQNDEAIKKLGITKKPTTSKKSSLLKKSKATRRSAQSIVLKSSPKVEKPLFFWLETGQEGYLSPWYELHPFTGYDCKNYESVGHYMMAEKARLFGDEISLKKIFATKDANRHRRLGSKIAGFDEVVWKEECYKIAEDAIKMRFKKNAELCARLLKTGGRELIDASPHDRIWGIGYKASDAKKHVNRDLWGENLFGKALMSARANLGLPFSTAVFDDPWSGYFVEW